MNYDLVLYDDDFNDNLLNKENSKLNDYILLFSIKKIIISKTNYGNFSLDNFNLEYLNEKLGKYFSKFNYKDHLSEIRSINTLNKVSILVVALDNYKFFDEINNDEFSEFYDALPKNSLRSLLQNKKIIKKFPIEITNILMSNSKNAEILIDSIKSEFHYSFPNNFDEYKRNELLSEYIKSEESNPNYLKIIYQANFDPKVDDMVRFRAKEAYESSINQIFKEHTSKKISFKVSIMPFENDSEFKRSNYSESKLATIEWNRNWIEKNLDDNATILQNLIYLLELVDDNFMISALPINEEDGILIRDIFEVNDIQKMYPVTPSFEINETLSKVKIKSYYDFLKHNGIYLEKVIKWFFESYLPQSFDIKGFDFRLAPENSSYYEKNVQLTTALHRIYKEYIFYTKYNAINKKALRISTIAPSISDLQSLSKDKYIYVNDSEIKIASKLLFSDQSMFGFGVNNDQKISAKLLSGVKRNKFPKRDQKDIDFLLLKKILIEDKGIIKFTSQAMYSVLKLLFKKESLNTYNLPKEIESLVSEGLKEGIFSGYSTLLSNEEIDYFNYYLTDYFSNGLGIRNKYHHGMNEDLTEDENKENFYIIIYLISILTIKINQEITENNANSDKESK